MPFTKLRIFALFFSLLLGMTGGRMLYTTGGPTYRLTHWHIHGIMPQHMQHTVQTTLKSFQGSPLHPRNLSLIHTRLIQDPWISTLRLQCQWPHTLHVFIQPHVPLAVWQSPTGQYQLLSQTGQHIPLKHPSQWPKTLPLVVGARITPFIQTLKKLTCLPYSVPPQAFVVHATGRWDILFPSHQRVQLPLKDPEKALYILPQIHRRLRPRHRSIRVIDLRFLPIVKVRFAP